MNKEKLIATINDMPQDFELELLMEKLVFIEKVEKGLEQLNSGHTITHEEVKQLILTNAKKEPSPLERAG